MMRRILPLALVSVLAVAACSDTDTAVAPDLETTVAADRSAADNAPIYIVMFRPGVDAAGAASDIAGTLGVSPRFVWSAAGGFSAAIPEARLEQVRGDARVAVVSPNGIVSLPDPVRDIGAAAPPWCPDPDDPRCGGDDDGGDSGSQTTPWGIARVGGPGTTASGSAWVIDTGIDLDHGDLNVSTACSANFVTRGKKSPDDGHGHGTHVAGTIAAIDNSQDVVGVAPGSTLCAVRVLDNSGSGTWEWVINGVDYVGANASSGDVANMSLGGSASGSEPNALEQAIMTAVDARGAQFTLAAGNDGEHADNHTPARLDYNGVFTVSASDSNDCLTSWSNYGNPPVDYAEPGASILSTAKGGGTTTMSGTSMAAPHLAGILLLGTPGNGGTVCTGSDPDGNEDTIGTL